MRQILILFLLTVGLSSENLVKQIDNECEIINNSLETFTKVENVDIDVFQDLSKDNYSYESVNIYRVAVINLIRFYDKNAIRKSIVNFDGDRQDLISEYFYKNDSLILVSKTRVDYDKPKWSEGFNEKENKTFENKFYFKNNELINWINSENKTVDLSRVDKMKATRIISDSELYRSIEK